MKTGKMALASKRLPMGRSILLLILWLNSLALGQHFAYVTNAGSGDVSVIDLAGNTVVATVVVGDMPQGLVTNPAGTAVYVANTVSTFFSMIDTTTYESVSIEGGLVPVGITIHPNGRYLYMANIDYPEGVKSTVSVIDRATNTIVDEIVCGNSSIGVEVHPDGSVVYVANIGDGTLAVFDTATHQVLDKIVLEPVGEEEDCGPVPMAVHPQGTTLYVANRLGPTVWAVNTATHEVVSTASGHAHVGIAVNKAGTAVYVPDFHDREPNMPPQGSTVDVLDARTLEPITTIEGFSAPLDISTHPDGTRLYVTNNTNDTVSVVDAATNMLIDTIAVGNGPNGYGEFVGPGVPRLLLEDATARLRAAKEIIEGGAEGVISPALALEQLDAALVAGELTLQTDFWHSMDAGDLDPRRLDAALGCAVFGASNGMVEATLAAIRMGWIVNTQLHTELLAIADAVVRADRVLAAVVIDDAILSGADGEKLNEAQTPLDEGNSLSNEAAVWEQVDRKAALLSEAVAQYQRSWQRAQN